MSTQVQIDINLVIAIIAILVSVVSFIRVGKWHSNDDTKENAKTIATILEKVDNIEKAVSNIPELRERIIVNEQEAKATEKRINALEQRRG